MTNITGATFTHEEAIDICEDFEDLIDTEFRFDDVMLFIDDVAVCPYSDEDKRAFADRYYTNKDKAGALSAYTGAAFDVMVFASNTEDETDMTYFSIRTYVAQSGTQYNFPEAV